MLLNDAWLNLSMGAVSTSCAHIGNITSNLGEAAGETVSKVLPAAPLSSVAPAVPDATCTRGGQGDIARRHWNVALPCGTPAKMLCPTRGCEAMWECARW